MLVISRIQWRAHQLRLLTHTHERWFFVLFFLLCDRLLIIYYWRRCVVIVLSKNMSNCLDAIIIDIWLGKNYTTNRIEVSAPQQQSMCNGRFKSRVSLSIHVSIISPRLINVIIWKLNRLKIKFGLTFAHSKFSKHGLFSRSVANWQRIETPATVHN